MRAIMNSIYEINVVLKLVVFYVINNMKIWKENQWRVKKDIYMI